MTEEKKSASQEVYNKNHSKEATAEVRKYMADPNLMKSRAYKAPKNTVNPKANELPPGMAAE